MSCFVAIMPVNVCGCTYVGMWVWMPICAPVYICCFSRNACWQYTCATLVALLAGRLYTPAALDALFVGRVATEPNMSNGCMIKDHSVK